MCENPYFFLANIYGWWFWASLWDTEIGTLQEPHTGFMRLLCGHTHEHYWVHLYGYFYWLSHFHCISACLWKVPSVSDMSASLHHHHNQQPKSSEMWRWSGASLRLTMVLTFVWTLVCWCSSYCSVSSRGESLSSFSSTSKGENVGLLCIIRWGTAFCQRGRN